MDDSEQSYQVLARKYRPMTFEDMIGQEALVTTLTNAFKTKRVAHAFMLTGVRGIGKTTTARLLARALNYEGEHEGPSVVLDPPGIHCEAINKSSHMDVMEMDAASRTGVGDIREILDSVRYAPVSARYKVYIIDEVHMLSSAAFNALLKTLEEPPDHAKFIFATTEIRKIPITVLSRCQRFDLRRVEGPELAAHLKNICGQENANISDDGLAMIARAAEGSVRDGLSLLDQAIVQQEGESEVSAETVRAMLGLADRVRVMDLFALAAKGDAKGALTEARSQYHDGADPVVIVRDLLDCCHDVSRAKVLGADGDFDLAPDQITRIHELAADLSMGQITRLWQMLLASHDEVRRAPDPLAAAEMSLLRMAVAADLPSPELAAQILSQINAAGGGSAGGASASSGSSGRSTSSGASSPSAQVSQTQMPSAPSASQAPPQTTMSSGSRPERSLPSAPPQETPAAQNLIINSLEELVAGMPKTATELKFNIRRHMRIVTFEPGKIVFEHRDEIPPSLAIGLAKYLQETTGKTWLLVPDADAKGAPSLIEQQKRAATARAEAEQSHPLIAKARELFPGVEIEIRDRDAISNVIEANFSQNKEE